MKFGLDGKIYSNLEITDEKNHNSRLVLVLVRLRKYLFDTVLADFSICHAHLVFRKETLREMFVDMPCGFMPNQYVLWRMDIDRLSRNFV